MQKIRNFFRSKYYIVKNTVLGQTMFMITRTETMQFSAGGKFLSDEYIQIIFFFQ